MTIAPQLRICDQYRTTGPSHSHSTYTAAVSLDYIPQWINELQLTFELADMHVADLYHQVGKLEDSLDGLREYGQDLHSAVEGADLLMRDAHAAAKARNPANRTLKKD